MTFLLLFGFTNHLSISYAQPTDNEDSKLAAHYYNKGEFHKAETYYAKLYKKYKTKIYFEKYYDCLVFQEKYKDAEKVVEKRIKSNPYDIVYQFNLADIYKKTNRQEEAIKLYESLIENISPVQSQIQNLGRQFTAQGAYNYAIRVYEKGRKVNKSGYQYNLEMAELYALMDDSKKMIETYLDLLEYSSGYLKSVQTYLNRQIDFSLDDKKVGILKQSLLKRTQNNPNKTYYNEMLIWYYVQKEEFTGAVIQSKALDVKEKSRGRHTYDIGLICQSNKVYDKAKQAYEYVKEFGSNSPYYTLASQNLLEVSFLQVTETGVFDTVLVRSVANEFELELKKLGKRSNTVSIMEQLARIYAYYLKEPATAISLLEEAITLAASPIDKARVKVLLGDVLVTDNHIWEASIYYMQVANQFEEDKIGHEAKFKNAKVFYYDGEFEYAKAQLDVLKASTTKLIANDAMQLSLLLQDNLGIDTTEAPVQMFAKADLLLQQNQYSQAIVILDSIKLKFPFHSLADEILYQKGLIYSQQKQWETAILFFDEVANTYSFDILADDAIFKMAEIYDYRLNNGELAAEYYKKILFDFPASLYNSIARERYRALKAI